ncbi:MAG: riboflavin synthase [Alphaproteobacteria bacterium]|nr:riboflavin synthase [Alphaproteobacteria bacterium]
MFTGIIADIGRVRAIAPGGDTRIEIETGLDLSGLAIGASIACAGVCLSVIDKDKDWFAVQASAETLARTTLGDWKKGTAVNLERALCLGDELGGHLVSGHVDGIAVVEKVEPEGESLRLRFRGPAALGSFLAPKGSVTLDGVSLTVNEAEGAAFGVNIIPHTRQMTTFGHAKEGTRVNVEVDLLARYLARLMEKE